jgi:hypothetical protein
VDKCLSWDGDKGQIPMHSDLIDDCADSLEYIVYKQRTLDSLASTVTTHEFIRLLIEHDCHPSRRSYYGDNDWQTVTKKCAKMFRGVLKKENNVVYGSFDKLGFARICLQAR